MTPELHEQLMALSVPEKWEVLHLLWESEADAMGAEPIHPDLAAELDRRMARLAADPSTGATWEEVVRYAKAQIGGLAHAG